MVEVNTNPLSIRKKVVIITDIGRDPDDIIALLAVFAYPHIEVVAIVTTGGNTENRAILTRHWLRKMNVNENVKIVGDLSKGSE